MAAAKKRTTAAAAAKLLGKAPASYTVEHLQRMLQQFGVVYKKRDAKKHLIAKLANYAEKHPEITARERIEILRKTVHIQHIRWQIQDDNGDFEEHAYPPDHKDNVKRACMEVLQEFHKGLGKNPRVCRAKDCQKILSELDFPSSMGKCCDTVPDLCRSCIAEDLAAKVAENASTQSITCVMCGQTMRDADVKALTTKATYSA